MFSASTMMPIRIGSVDGVGHITNMRLVLFWDVEAALSVEAVENGAEAACA